MSRTETKPTTVGEFIKFLSQFPPEMELTEKRYSDMKYMDISDWYLAWGYPQQQGEYIELLSKEVVENRLRWYANEPEKLARMGLSEYDPSKLKQYLYFHGN